MNQGFKPPVLFIIFNRPETTKKVFARIREARPEYFFIAADGPRADKTEEKEKCEAARQIATQVDWPCEVKTLFRDKNLGCGAAVSSAIDWFFDNIEQGIILEDDCLPCPSFFGFCTEMLERYADEANVMMISGSNPAIELDQMTDDYFFSRNYNVWGWATWARAWKLYDREMKFWPAEKKTDFLKKAYPHRLVRDYFKEGFDQVYNKEVDTWDFQWAYSCLKNGGLSIMPKLNQVSNIGQAGTHTGQEVSGALFRKTALIDLDHLQHPAAVQEDAALDLILFEAAGLTRRTIKQRLVRLLLELRLFKVFQKIINAF